MSAGLEAVRSLANADGELPPEEVIFGRSRAMQAVRQRVEKVCSTNVPVLIQGESGTGKEMLARLVHSRSPWRTGSFVKVNCAAIPGSLLESELFGYQKGAFTGANTSKPGRVEMAHQGTLFLDEIAELDAALQAKLLQLLQDGQFCRIGDSEERHVDARVICATNRNLEQETATGGFRVDLFYRINVINIVMPRLQERREDIPLLAEFFLAYFNRRFQRSASSLSKELTRYLQEREWPGNIRELENCVARYVLLGADEAFCNDHHAKRTYSLPLDISAEGGIPLKRMAKQAIREMERNVILRVLQENHWNRRKSAQILNISYRALIYKIREAGLSPRNSRRKPAAGPEAGVTPAAQPD